MKTKLLPAALCVLTVLAGTASVAHDAGEETTTPLQRQKLTDVPGKTGIVVLVSYAPGQASQPHVHPGSVFAYVVEGEVVSQLDGQPAMTYRAGQSWYEPPRVPHLVSRNASEHRAGQAARLADRR